MRGDVTDAGQPTKQQQLKIELLSQWKLDAESRKFHEDSLDDSVNGSQLQFSSLYQDFMVITSPIKGD